MRQIPEKRFNKAFTLIEMIMVMVVALMMMSLALPSFTSLLSTNKEKAAIRTIRSMMTLAQSRAAANKRNTGVRFQFDLDSANPADPLRWQQGIQYMVLVENTDIKTTGVGVPIYRTYPDTKAIALPQGIAIIHGGITNDFYGTGSINSYLADSTSKIGINDSVTFTIIFSPTGQVTIESNFAVLPRDTGNDQIINLYPSFSTLVPLLQCDINDKVIPLWLNYFNTASGNISEISAASFYIAETEALMKSRPNYRYDDYIYELKPYLLNIFTGQFLPRDE